MEKTEFGKLLKSFLKKEQEIVKISRWVFRVYSNDVRNLDDSMTEIMESLFSMEDDPQFEYTIEELNTIADMLIHNEENPLKRVLDGRLNKDFRQ